MPSSFHNDEHAQSARRRLTTRTTVILPPRSAGFTSALLARFSVPRPPCGRPFAQPGSRYGGSVVTVEPYNRDWPRLFEEQAIRLRRALGSRITEIEHTGSTAIPGLAAMPIIDLAARAAPGIDPFKLAPVIAVLGYNEHRSRPKNYAVYVRGTDAGRTQILNVFRSDGWELCNQRIFRDKLLHDASARRRYGDLKFQLAASVNDGAGNTAGKRELIQALLNEEQAARGFPPTIAWDK